MAKDPAFLFYSQDFMGGISGLTMEERGQYITMLCLQHQSASGSINEKTIRLSVGSVSVDVLNKFIKDENGELYNERLRTEIEKRTQYAESRRLNGLKGGRPKNHMQTICKPYEEAYKNHTENENINENINTNEEKGKRGVGRKPKEETPTVIDLVNFRIYGSEWRKDFSKYMDGLRQCFSAILRHQEWTQDIERYHPSIDINLTLEKACKYFWATEAGWKNKKASKSEYIDWKSTFTNALSIKSNLVYKTNGKGSNKISDDELMQAVESGMRRGYEEREKRELRDQQIQ